MIEIDNKFIEEYEHFIRHTICKMIKGRDAQDDVYSDVIIRLLSHNNYDENKGAVTTWLNTVVKSVCWNYLDHKNRKADALDSHSRVDTDISDIVYGLDDDET